MRSRFAVLFMLLFGVVLFAAIGCSDDEKSTNGNNQNVLSDSAAVEDVSSSLEDGGLGLVQGAISSAVSDFKGYEPPDIDGTIGGYGKISMPQTDTFYYENGWHIFFADETVTTDEDSVTTVWDFTVSDSTRLEKDGVPGFLLPDPDFLDMRTYIDLNLDQHSQNSDFSLDLSLYRHGVLTLKTNDDLWVDLDENFDIALEAEGEDIGAAKIVATNDKVNMRYVYDIAVKDLVLTKADDYDCPTAGTLDMTVTVYVTDGTNTLTGSAQVHLVITSPGVVSGTITSGDFVEEFTDDSFCADAASLPDNPWVRFMSM